MDCPDGSCNPRKNKNNRNNIRGFEDDIFKELFESRFSFGFGGFDELADLMFKDFENLPVGKRYVKGFSMTMGPDGVPVIKEYSNIPNEFDESPIPRNPGDFINLPDPYGRKPLERVPSPIPPPPSPVSEERKPIIDVMKTGGDVRVIMEMPGVSKEAIEVNALETTLELKAECDGRLYNEKINLGCRVFPDSAKASYNNGVLEVVIKVKEPEIGEEEKRKVEVE